ncbi:zf-DHHC-domain-containing protein [Ramicandelaber brevisporus]|nr:zf-DHHC-domain-containing protein [Ramicandelaber brevisporus]KAI8870272.1 zf-DHHC-domain-containing protein [Ramicandelaber brevisporus]
MGIFSGPRYRRFVRIIGFLPVLMSSGLVGWSYWAYFTSVLPESIGAKIVYLVIYNALFVMFVWSNFAVVATSPGYVSEGGEDNPPPPQQPAQQPAQQQPAQQQRPQQMPAPSHSLYQQQQHYQQSANEISVNDTFVINMPPPTSSSNNDPNANIRFRSDNDDDYASDDDDVPLDSILTNRFSTVTGRPYRAVTTTYTGQRRFCSKCRVLKPDRAHHCSVTGKCVLRFDHYCPWVATAIGFGNHKQFVLFITYGVLYCWWVFCTTIPALIEHMSDPARVFDTNLLFLAIASGIFGFALIGFSGYHIYLVLTNSTTLESQFDNYYDPAAVGADYGNDVPYRNLFDLGRKKNFMQMFGRNPALWLIPVKSALGDGWSYPLCIDSMALQEAQYESNNDGEDRESGDEQRRGRQPQLFSHLSRSNSNNSGHENEGLVSGVLAKLGWNTLTVKERNGYSPIGRSDHLSNV